MEEEEFLFNFHKKKKNKKTDQNLLAKNSKLPPLPPSLT
jgi:hypothetical protein